MGDQVLPEVTRLDSKAVDYEASGEIVEEEIESIHNQTQHYENSDISEVVLEDNNVDEAQFIIVEKEFLSMIKGIKRRKQKNKPLVI